MIIVLKPGESIEVQFADCDGNDCDGSITTAYHDDAIRVITDWPDSTGRVGIVYEEKFGEPEVLTQPWLDRPFKDDKP